MRYTLTFLALLLCVNIANAQWKAQTAETYEKTYRIALVNSAGGGETLRILRPVNPGARQKGDPYDQIMGQILLNKDISTKYKVVSIVFRFDDSPKMYINQPAELKQEWDPNVRRFIIESDWSVWRMGDTRNKQARSVDNTANPITKKQIIDMFKAKQKVICQIALINKTDGTQTMMNMEFTLKNSTKSINYLFL